MNVRLGELKIKESFSLGKLKLPNVTVNDGGYEKGYEAGYIQWQYDATIDPLDLQDMLDELMPIEVSVVDELYKMLKIQEEIIQGGSDHGFEEPV